MRKTIFIPGAALMVVLGTPWPVSAELEFETTVVERHVKPEDDAFEVKYPFVNRGSEDVKIVKVESSCGCLKAETDQEVFKPGEKGVLTGLFTIGSMTGEHEKALWVNTDEKKNGRYEVKARVHVPEIVKIEPKVLSWVLGEEPGPKELVFSVERDKPIQITNVTCSREGFQYEVEAIEEGRKYRVILRPESTESPLLGVLRIETDCEILKHQRYMAFFSVKRPPTSG